MKKYILIILVFAVLQSCVEPFEVETQQLESLLVVDARLTDEEKQHVILLSRARPFEEDEIIAERNAMVKITDDVGNTYAFMENQPGEYLSETAFSALQNRSYELSIVTSDQQSYISEKITTPEVAAIENLYIEREINDKGEGISVYLGTNNSESAKYFRYEYEETYKIIAPFWDPFEFEIINDNVEEHMVDIGIKIRQEESQVCYETFASTNILLYDAARTSGENSRFPVRFISRNNYIISHRYSISVKQYNLTEQAYFYFLNLKDFSSSESVFSDTQPGFLEGNIYSDSNPDKKIIGYFDVASVSTKRNYFNYADLFPGDALPPYAINCIPIGSPLFSDHGRYPLLEAIQADIVSYFGDNPDFDRGIEGPYFTKAKACGYCTELGSNIKPDFWVED